MSWTLIATIVFCLAMLARILYVRGKEDARVTTPIIALLFLLIGQLAWVGITDVWTMEVIVNGLTIPFGLYLALSK